jgi:xylulokinase
VVRSGVVSSSIGTSGVIFAHSDRIALDPQGRLHTFCHSVPGQYHLMAVTLSAGGSFQWLRNVLRISDLRSQIEDQPDTNLQSAFYNLQLSYDHMTAMASSVPIGAEGLLFLPYLTGERTPHLDPLARGAFVGLTARHGAAHMIRAVMEGVVFSLRDGLEIMRELGLPLGEVRATGGGGRSPLWRQMQADIYGAEVATLAAEEGPAYGAALLAGVGAGVFVDVGEAVDRCVAVAGVTRPDPAAQARYEQVYAVYRDMYGALREGMQPARGAVVAWPIDTVAENKRNREPRTESAEPALSSEDQVATSPWYTRSTPANPSSILLPRPRAWFLDRQYPSRSSRRMGT